MCFFLSVKGLKFQIYENLVRNRWTIKGHALVGDRIRTWLIGMYTGIPIDSMTLAYVGVILADESPPGTYGFSAISIRPVDGSSLGYFLREKIQRTFQLPFPKIEHYCQNHANPHLHIA